MSTYVRISLYIASYHSFLDVPDVAELDIWYCLIYVTAVILTAGKQRNCGTLSDIARDIAAKIRLNSEGL